MPVQEYAVDSNGENRVQIFREYDGGDLTVLLNRVILGSVSPGEDALPEQNFSLEDGSVLRVRYKDGKVEVLKNETALPEVPPLKESLPEASRPEGASQTMYLLARPFNKEAFEDEIFETSWEGVWGKIIGYIILFLVIPVFLLIRNYLYASFQPLPFLGGLIAFVAVTAALVIGFYFLISAVPYYLAKRLGGRGNFMTHCYIISVFTMPLIVLFAFIPFTIMLVFIANMLGTGLAEVPAAFHLLSLFNSHPINASGLHSFPVVTLDTWFLVILGILSVYYFCMSITAMRAVHKLPIGKAVLVSLSAVVLVWLAAVVLPGLLFS